MTMLKPLSTTFKGRDITLECTHKREFPPPQMYGSTPDDIDTLWKQGNLDQIQYQHLKVWHEKCGLMVMGPRCLDCPLALKQNPRPGRPDVIETEPWLAAKDKMHWEDMKAGKLGSPNGEPVHAGSHDEAFPVESTQHTPPSKRDVAKEMVDKGILDSEPDTPPSTEPDKKPLAEAEPEESSITDMLEGASESDEEEDADLDDDIISALADD